MANGIIPVQWGKELRPSAVNSLDKINEVIHFINQSDIHEFTFSDSGSGESVQTANSTQLLDLTVYGKSVQDGTPTPENPVPVQVVGGRNLYNPETRINGYWINDSGDINAAPNTFYSDKIPVIVGESYTFAITPIGDAFKRAVAYKSDDTFNGLLAKLTQTEDARQSETFTIPANTAYIRISGNANDIDAQVEQGTQATPYLPYGYISLQIGETITPIDLQGHTLAGLPDGTRDVLRVDSAGRVWIEQNVGHDAQTTPIAARTDSNGKKVWTFTLLNNLVGITSNALPNLMSDQYTRAKRDNVLGANKIDNSIGIIATAGVIGAGQAIAVYNPQVSAASVEDANVYFAAHPFEVYYQLATPKTIELGTITPPAIPDGSIIKINASLTPVIDVEWFTEDTLPKMMNSILGLIKSLHPDDFPAMLSSSLIHSINPTMQVPDIQPIDIVDLGAVEKIKTDATEETENESEVQ